MPAPSASPQSRSLRLIYRGGHAATQGHTYSLGADWLAGATEDVLFSGAEFAGDVGGLTLFRQGELWIGYVSEPFAHAGLPAATQTLYQRVFAACGARHLYRIWNHVPRINDASGGLENYQAFCLGRSLAFEEHFGPDFQSRLSAASAVGSSGENLELLFAAGAAPGKHVENPEQVPAYRYPAEHGPRAPSFARATIARAGDRDLIFISGTSAIKGHRTVAPGGLAAQLACTLDNLRLVSREAGLGDRLGANSNWTRHFKIYVRHAGDLPVVRTALERDWVRATDVVSYLRADICRADLGLEIEATLVR